MGYCVNVYCMNPKIFISYSWHPEENKIRVQQLARRLMSDGVDVILAAVDNPVGGQRRAAG